MNIEITISFGLLSYVNHRLVCRCPCDRQSVKREKHMFFSDKGCATPLDSTVLLSVESLRKNKEKKGNSWKTQDFKRQQRCTMNPQQKIFLISNTQTPLIQTLSIQGSTLHLVILKLRWSYVKLFYCFRKSSYVSCMFFLSMFNMFFDVSKLFVVLFRMRVVFWFCFRNCDSFH